MCGHTHQPFHRVIESDTGFKHVVNIGSVGKPKDGDPRIYYAILELNQNTITSNSEAMKVTFKRAEYNVEKAAKAVEHSNFSQSYADGLRFAR